MKKLFFLTQSGRITATEETEFRAEKELQRITERNLEELLGARFIKSEHRLHDGTRIDTLGITKERHPVIIEYKKVQSRNVVGQILSYATSLLTYRDAFELLIMKKLGRDESDKINWDSIRLICIAKDFSNHDFGYLRNSAREVELITYRYFNNDTLLFEWVDGDPRPPSPPSPPKPRPSPHPRPPKPRTNPSPPKPVSTTFAQLLKALKNTIEGLGPGITYYKTAVYEGYKKGGKAFVTFRPLPKKERVRVWLDLDPSKEKTDGTVVKDMRNVGHLGLGDLELVIDSEATISQCEHLLRKAYDSR